MTPAMAKYIGMFVSEAADHLASIGAELVRLEVAGRDGGETRAIVDELFRHVHSLKGMAASLELDGIAALAHRAEDLVGTFRGSAAPDPASIDDLLAAVDALTAMVDRVRAGESPDADGALLERLAATARTLRDRSSAQGCGSRGVAVEVEVAPGCPAPAVRGFLVVKRLERFGSITRAEPSLEDLRDGRLPDARVLVEVETAVPLGEVERTMAQISELERVAVREIAPPDGPISPAPVRHEPSRAESEVRAARRERMAADGGRTVRVRVDLLDAFLDAVGELILATARLREIGRGLPEPYRPSLDEGVDRLQGTVKDLHDQVMAVRMTPLSTATERLPRAARDLARRIGKQVEVEVRGAEIEIDRAILDELAEPVLHVLRNAVDHGIEPPEVRQRAGKPVTGRLTVTARRERDRVLLELADDGKGMDPERLRAAAVTRGALDAGAARALTDREALLLACLPGISTAEDVTEVSGRGVGMDAVKRTVEALGGSLDVESVPGAGTRWIFRLPLTVAVQPVLLVSVHGEVVGLPIAKVHGAAHVQPGALGSEAGAPSLLLEDRPVPVKDLGELLGFGARLGAPASVVVSEAEGGRVALAVDALIGQQDAVLKPLVRPFDRVSGLSAVTVLASGRPVFILDVQRLLAA